MHVTQGAILDFPFGWPNGCFSCIELNESTLNHLKCRKTRAQESSTLLSVSVGCSSRYLLHPALHHAWKIFIYEKQFGRNHAQRHGHCDATEKNAQQPLTLAVISYENVFKVYWRKTTTSIAFDCASKCRKYSLPPTRTLYLAYNNCVVFAMHSTKKRSVFEWLSVILLNVISHLNDSMHLDFVMSSSELNLSERDGFALISIFGS